MHPVVAIFILLLIIGVIYQLASWFVAAFGIFGVMVLILIGICIVLVLVSIDRFQKSKKSLISAIEKESDLKTYAENNKKYFAKLKNGIIQATINTRKEKYAMYSQKNRIVILGFTFVVLLFGCYVVDNSPMYKTVDDYLGKTCKFAKGSLRDNNFTSITGCERDDFIVTAQSVSPGERFTTRAFEREGDFIKLSDNGSEIIAKETAEKKAKEEAEARAKAEEEARKAAEKAEEEARQKAQKEKDNEKRSVKEVCLKAGKSQSQWASFNLDNLWGIGGREPVEIADHEWQYNENATIVNLFGATLERAMSCHVKLNTSTSMWKVLDFQVGTRR